MLQAVSEVVPELYSFVHAAYGRIYFSMENQPFSPKKTSNKATAMEELDQGIPHLHNCHLSPDDVIHQRSHHASVP